MTDTRDDLVGHVQLTGQQRRVIQLVAAGKTNWEIAQELGISLEGAKYHVSEIMARFDVHSREEAAAAWQAQERAPVRARRWLKGALGLFGSKSAAKLGLTAALAAVVIAGGAYLVFASQDGDPDAAGAPEIPDELLNRMEDALSQDDRLLRVRLETEWDNDGIDAMLSADALFDFREDRAVIGYSMDWENTTVPDRHDELLIDGLVYEFPDDPGEPPRQSTAAELHPACLDAGSYLAAVLACGIIKGSTGQDVLDVTGVVETTWQGTAVYGLTYEWVEEVEAAPSPGAAPTNTPSPGTPTAPPGNTNTMTTAYTFYVDSTTWLPLGIELVGTRSDIGSLGTYVIDYESELVDRSDVDESRFDPKAQGYQTPDEEEAQRLDTAIPGGQPYWLGRDFDPGLGLEPLTLESVRTEFAELIGLSYRSDSGSGGVDVGMWRADEWQAFSAMLEEGGRQVGNYVFAEKCLETMVVEAGGRQVTIYAGIDVQPAAGHLTTPTPTPAPGEACAPHDTYMAVVDVGSDYVVTLNAPGSVWGPGGRFGPYDSPEALTAIAARLRLRVPGE